MIETINRGIAAYADPGREMETREFCRELIKKQRRAHPKDLPVLEAELLRLFGRETMRAVLGREP